MPDPYSIPFKQADGNGHYKSKELPDDKQDFLTQLGVPSVFGDVLTGETSTVSGQLTTWYGTDGHTIKAVPTTTSGIVVAQNGVGTFEAHPAGAIVGTDAVQTLTNKTFGAGITFGSGVTFTGGTTGLTKADVGLSNVDNTSDAQKNAAAAILTNKTISAATINSPTFSGTVTGLTKASVGLGNVDNTSDLNKPISSQTQSALDGKENLSRYNVANGYAPLGADAKVPLANMPDAALGGSRYQGTWNALTNIPPIPPAASSNNGWYYVVSAAGNTSIDGINVWALGDTIISNGTYWQKIPNTNAVVSVNGKTGTVTLTKVDVGLSNVDNTSDSTKNSAVATLSNKTISGASNTLTVRLDADVINNLPVSRLNGGTGASAATFWRGDGLWVSPTGAGDVQGPGVSVDGEVTVFSGTTGKVLRVFGGAAGFAKVGPGTALSTVPTIGALDVNASLVHGQTQKTTVDGLDELLVWDNTSNTLKSMRYSTAVWNMRMRSFNAFQNPNFEVDQINCGALVANCQSYTCDRWIIGNLGSSRVSAQQVAASPNIVLPGTSFNVSSKYMRLTLTTQQASLGAGDVLAMRQAIEGCNLRELLGGVHSISLLVRSSVANLKFAVALQDGGQTFTLTKLCTMGAANTWTLITLPNLPVWTGSVTWSTAPGVIAYYLHITLVAGTGVSAAPDVWAAGNKYGATGMDNFANSALNSTFDMAFVQHEPGDTCTPLMDKSWTVNYDECQRYFQKTYDYATAVGTITGLGVKSMNTTAPQTFASGGWHFVKPMVRAPTVTFYDHTSGAANTVYDLAVHHGSASAANVSETGFSPLNFATATTGPLGVYFHYRADTAF